MEGFPYYILSVVVENFDTLKKYCEERELEVCVFSEDSGVHEVGIYGDFVYLLDRRELSNLAGVTNVRTRNEIEEQERSQLRDL